MLRETGNTLRYFYKCNFVLLPKLMVIACPLLTVCLYKHIDGMMYGKWSTALMLLMFVLVWLFAAKVLKFRANKANIGEDIPLPAKRFTRSDSFGNISVSYEEIDDMVLYVYDVEQYLERRGLV